MAAAVLESDLWWIIVDIIALTFKKLAEEHWVSVEQIIDDILSEDNFNS